MIDQVTKRESTAEERAARYGGRVLGGSDYKEIKSVSNKHEVDFPRHVTLSVDGGSVVLIIGGVAFLSVILKVINKFFKV